MKALFKKIRPFIIPIIVTMIVVLLFHYIFMLGYVPTSSMEPTLEAGSLILGLRHFDDLETGDSQSIETFSALAIILNSASQT